MAIIQEELARRLRAARESCHLTQEDVARHLGVSRPTIAQIELGNRAVSSLELDKLAYLYGRGISHLLADDSHEDDAVVALFRLHPEIAGQEEVQSALRESMAMGRELSSLERILGIERDRGALPVYAVRLVQARWEAVRQGEQTALDERHRLQLGDVPLPDIAELLESQGVRTAQLELPDDVSGLTLIDQEIGAFVVVNNRLPAHSRLRRRFSLAHEYCHVLLDRELKGTISLTGERASTIEVRANAFAAAFLMPSAGVQELVKGLGKGRESRLRSEVFDEVESQTVQSRPEPKTQTLQMHDVALTAHHFGVSRLAAMYRLKNLDLLNQVELDALIAEEAAGRGRSLSALLGFSDPDDAERNEFRHRFLALALEAFRREEITRSKLGELAAMVGVSAESLDAVLSIGQQQTQEREANPQSEE